MLCLNQSAKALPQLADVTLVRRLFVGGAVVNAVGYDSPRLDGQLARELVDRILEIVGRKDVFQVIFQLGRKLGTPLVVVS